MKAQARVWCRVSDLLYHRQGILATARRYAAGSVSTEHDNKYSRIVVLLTNKGSNEETVDCTVDVICQRVLSFERESRNERDDSTLLA